MARCDHKLFRAMAGVKLDVGCGRNKQPGFLGLDRVRLPGVDIVHDIQKFPWPVPSNACSVVLLANVWPQVEPKYRSRLMDELWRIVRHDGQVLISAPYAGTFLAHSDPDGYGGPTELTFLHYCPDCAVYRDSVKPWKIVRNDPNFIGNIEVILEPYKDKHGKTNWKRTGKV